MKTNEQLIESLQYHTYRLNEVSVGLLKKAASNVGRARFGKAVGTALNPFKSAAAKSNAFGRAMKAGVLKQMKVGSGKMAANKVVNAARNSASARLAKINKPVMNAVNSGSPNATNLVKRGITANAIGNKPSTAMNNLKSLANKPAPVKPAPVKPAPVKSAPVKSAPVKSAPNKLSGLKKVAIGTAAAGTIGGAGYLGYKAGKKV